MSNNDGPSQASLTFQKWMQNIFQTLLVAAILGVASILYNLNGSVSAVVTRVDLMYDAVNDIELKLLDRYTATDATRDNKIMTDRLNRHGNRITKIENDIRSH